MHRPKNPPPVAPPLVAPPLPEAVSPRSTDRASERASTLGGRVVRDLTIGGVCLLGGWLVAQPRLVDRLGQASIFDGLRSIPGHVDVAATTASIIVAQPSQLIDPPDPFETPLSFADLPLQIANQAYRSQPTEAPQPSSESVDLDQSVAAIGQPRATDDSETPPSDAVADETSVDESMAAPSPTKVADASDQPQPSPPPVVDTSMELPGIDSLVALTSPTATGAAQCVDGTCPSDTEMLESHGTVLAWAETPADAYRMSVEHEKLVFMIHVSGNFEIPGFT
jgi:hypothetical protein